MVFPIFSGFFRVKTIPYKPPCSPQGHGVTSVPKDHSFAEQFRGSLVRGAARGLAAAPSRHGRFHRSLVRRAAPALGGSVDAVGPAAAFGPTWAALASCWGGSSAFDASPRIISTHVQRTLRSGQFTQGKKLEILRKTRGTSIAPPHHAKFGRGWKWYADRAAGPHMHASYKYHLFIVIFLAAERFAQL